MFVRVKHTSVMLKEGSKLVPTVGGPWTKFSEGRSAGLRHAERHGDADRLFTATSVL